VKPALTAVTSPFTLISEITSAGTRDGRTTGVAAVPLSGALSISEAVSSAIGPEASSTQISRSTDAEFVIVTLVAERAPAANHSSPSVVLAHV